MLNSLALSQDETPDTAVVYLGGNDIAFDSGVPRRCAIASR